MDPNTEFDKNRPPRHPFTVPDRYFEELPTRVQQRIQQPTDRGSAWSLLFGQYRLQTALAAVLILVASVWVLQRNQLQTTALPQQVAVAELTDEEIANYLTGDYQTLETSDLAMLTSVDEHLPYAVPTEVDQELEAELEMAAIDEYLL